MRSIVKCALLFIAAAGFGVVFSPLLTVTLNDALLDFLDEETAKTVTDYFRRTEVSRAFGIAIVLLVWAGLVTAIDRIIDSTMKTQCGTSGPQAAIAHQKQPRIDV
jgi:uncharacterized BrkB/YihY/UPF0761 family membrane protein